MARFRHEKFVVSSTVVALSLAAIGLAVAIMAAVGYASGRVGLYTWLDNAPMAIPTMVALLVISLAVIVNSILLSIVINEMTNGDLRYQRRSDD